VSENTLYLAFGFLVIGYFIFSFAMKIAHLRDKALDRPFALISNIIVRSGIIAVFLWGISQYWGEETAFRMVAIHVLWTFPVAVIVFFRNQRRVEREKNKGEGRFAGLLSWKRKKKKAE